MPQVKRLVVLAALVLAVALAAAGAGWKWLGPARQGHAFGPEKVAGWTWDGAERAQAV